MFSKINIEIDFYNISIQLIKTICVFKTKFKKYFTKKLYYYKSAISLKNVIIEARFHL